jgi:hypothetical protein
MGKTSPLSRHHQMARTSSANAGRSKNARSLFISGAMTWARWASVSCSYQLENPARTGSVMAAVTRERRASASSEHYPPAGLDVGEGHGG